MTIQLKEKTPVMISGPGKMGNLVAGKIIRSEDFSLHGFAFTGEKTKQEKWVVEGQEIQLLDKAKRALFKREYFPANGIVLDFTQPDATLSNINYYCAHGLDFVMGTTGVDMPKALEKIKSSTIKSMISPNMAKQVVKLQLTTSDFAKDNVGGLRGCTIKIEESHQGPDLERPEFKAKRDPSGTAIAISRDLGTMGVERCPFDGKDIMANSEKYKDSFVMIRDRKYQLDVLKVPKEYLDGHGWHTYTLVQNGIVPAFLTFTQDIFNFMNTDPVFASYSRNVPLPAHSLVRRIAPDGNALFEIELSYTPESMGKSPVLQLRWKHNINGRDIYADGALDALRFLRGRTEVGSVFSMADTLK